MKFSNKTMGPEFLDNNYKASFVEQEIGFSKWWRHGSCDVIIYYVIEFNLYFLGSQFYLGASLSSWTQTVLTDRLARNNKKHDSVLKIVTNGKLNYTIKWPKILTIIILGAPGYPELVFQFPEGDFTFGGMIAGKKV